MRHAAMIGCVLAGSLALGTAGARAQGLTPVPAANPKVPGVVVPNVLSVELAEVVRARGAMKLENPSDWAAYYAYNNDQPNLVPLPPPATFNVEATKTEPDKNT